MRSFAVFVVSLAVLGCQVQGQSRSAADVAQDIYRSCLTSEHGLKCAKVKALAWMASVAEQDEIAITDSMTVVRTGTEDPEAPTEVPADHQQQRAYGAVQMLNKIDSFLATHALKLTPPSVLRSEEARAYIPESLRQGGLADDLVIPLTEGNVAEGRGFVKKVMLPFLLGIKFKSTVLVPLALALIALKTWKAMTLGLLSLVLSGAMMIFKFAKPKIVNYEVVHYPPPHHVHHVDHHVDHHAPHVHWDAPPAWKKRSLDAHEQAYAGQL
ncbi:uncharacterized protein LOC131288097 [Anopheles ziemanni]|uniref:uncharacterized protein LOC131258499 n=1 Tax=Anopheles coustani TaxID=139045 RepID=UPI002657F8FB|nr:uncharacterized protein LOC131258499 [Anopheles coustani]XP_058173180.1 uncharacterized protein LOC131288097 [Anopheles ziemanni]